MKKTSFLLTLSILALFTMSFVLQEDWVSFEGNGYKMRFPKKPTDESQEIVTAIGKSKMFNYIYEVPETEKDANLVYGISEFAYPDTLISSDKKNILDKFFRGSIDGAVKNLHGKLLTETVIQLGGYPGRAFRIDFQDGKAVVTMHSYLVKNTLYVVEVITDTKNDFNKSMDKFFNSFALK